MIVALLLQVAVPPLDGIEALAPAGRPHEEENHAAVAEVYRALGAGDRVRYLWYPGDHDFPPHARKEAVAWFGRFFK